MTSRDLKLEMQKLDQYIFLIIIVCYKKFHKKTLQTRATCCFFKINETYCVKVIISIKKLITHFKYLYKAKY